MKKTHLLRGSILLFILGLSACEIGDDWTRTTDDPDITEVIGDVDTGATVEEIMEANKVDHDTEEALVYDSNDAMLIELLGQSVREDAEGVVFGDQELRISAAGIYRLTGTLEDAQLLVETEEEDAVILILDGVDIHSSTGAALYVVNAACTLLELAEGSENYFSDAAEYSFENADEDEPDACIFSKDDLSIDGEGSLNVTASYRDGIASKDGLVIKSGTINISAADDGIRGKDYLVVKGGSLNIEAGGDGLKSTNEDESDCGYVYIEAGSLQLSTAGDAIHAVSDALVKEANMVAVTGGGASAYSSSATSSKGIKGAVYAVIDGGYFSLDTRDDAVHSNKVMIINGGNFSIASGDDAFHADSLLVVNDGFAEISESYEGVESTVITFNGGDFHITSSDDGVNVASGNDGSGVRPGGGPGGPGMDQFSSSGDNYLYMQGGYVAVNAMGDGIDINGSVVMSGGTLIVDGPSSDNNGALDYDGSFTISGGFLLGTGSSGMAQAPGSQSGQYSVLVNFQSALGAGTLVHMETGSDGSLFTFSPSKRYQSVVFSSPGLSSGESYSIYTGGSYTGTLEDGLLTEGDYSGGTEYRNFTISGITTLLR